LQGLKINYAAYLDIWSSNNQ